MNAYLKKFLFIIFVLTFLSGFGEQPSIKVCFTGVCIQAEVAQSDMDRQEGLMFRQKMGEYEGMLFVFPQESIPSFWMKNMLFPLDVIWLDKDKKIVGIAKNQPLCSKECLGIDSPMSVLYAIEVNAGFCERHNINVGQKVKFKIKSPLKSQSHHDTKSPVITSSQ